MSQPFLIEVSSEAGRKVGGIYTVLQTKSRYVSEHFKDRYLLIGYYDERCAQDVHFSPPPKPLEPIFAQLASEGVFCHYGHWTYGSNMPIILVDAHNFAERLVSYDDNGTPKIERQVNYVKFLLWKSFGIDSLMDTSGDFSENVVWGWAVGMLLEKLCEAKPYSSHALIAQFHEWIAGSALLYCHSRSLPIGTVFTTHATVLGRSLAAGGVDVLSQAQSSPRPIEISEAYRLKVEGKHQLEMAAAKKSNVFTTVSETVALECRYILGRYPDVITLNGLDFDQAQAEAKVRDLTVYSRAELLQLVEACFIPYYVQRYDNALLTFISGRYEFTNKGFDIYIAALGELNARIKRRGPKDGKKVIGLIFAPSSVRGPKISIIKNYLLLDKINEVLDAAPIAHEEHYPNLQARLAAVHGTLRADLEAMASGFIRDGERPHINLFDLNYANDEIIRACVSAGLTNGPDDAVKVLFYPTYLRPNDGLLSMNYYDIVSGMDVGIFPSRYEPFGYTPLEAGLKFNVAVSTDAAGFGRYLQSQVNLEERGVRILRMAGGAQPAIKQLADFLEELYYAHHSKLENYKEDSYKLMHLFDWKLLISNYLRAYALAIDRRPGITARRLPRPPPTAALSGAPPNPRARPAARFGASPGPAGASGDESLSWSYSTPPQAAPAPLRKIKAEALAHLLEGVAKKSKAKMARKKAKRSREKAKQTKKKSKSARPKSKSHSKPNPAAQKMKAKAKSSAVPAQKMKAKAKSRAKPSPKNKSVPASRKTKPAKKSRSARRR